MKITTKISLTFCIVAMVSSLPLTLIVAMLYSNHHPLFVKILLFSSSILLGLIASAWYLIIARTVPVLWEKSPPVFGAIIGLLTFITYGVAFGIWGVITGQAPFFGAFNAIGGFSGLLLFGWIPIILGALSGWFGAMLSVYGG